MISIITPTYNEASNIEFLIKEIHKNLKKNYEIIVVDDNSPDLTWKIALNLSKKYPIRVIRRKGKLGLSTAVIEGFNASKGNILCVIDADLSHPPSLLPKLINEIKKGNDLAIGSRKIPGGRVERWPFMNKVQSLVGIVLSKPLTNIKDPMSGYFAIRKELTKNIKFTTKGYKILLELLVKSNAKKVIEIPYVFENREHGKSKQGLREWLYYLLDTSRLYFYKIIKYLR